MENQNTELVKVDPKQFGIEEQKANEMMGNLPQILSERSILEPQFDAVLKMDIENPITAKVAGELKKLVRNNRTKGIEIWHKTTKEFFLRGGQFVDAVRRKESAVNERMEGALEEIEKYQEIKEAERKAKLKAERLEKIAGLTENPEMYPLSEMNDAAFDQLLTGLILAKKQKEEAEKAAEAERLEAIRLEAERVEKIRLENERLQKEAEQKEKEREAERQAQAKILAQQKAEADRIAKIEAEKQAKIQAELNTKAEAERKERERIEKELKAKQDAERLAKEKAESEAKAKELEEKKAAKAPDKTKLIEFAKMVASIQMPEVKSPEAEKILFDAKTLLDKVSKFVTEKSNEL